MEHEFYTNAQIIVRVEAGNRDEARRIMNDLVRKVRANLPTGVSVNFAEDGDFPVYRA